MTDEPLHTHRPLVERLCADAFGDGAVAVEDLEDVNRGRGAFSVVLRARLTQEHHAARSVAPPTIVAKLPVTGPNGAAAITTGAYQREALAYGRLLDDLPIRVPQVHAIHEPGDGSCALLLQDLTDHRAVDQLDGLGRPDAIRVAQALAELHAHWRRDDRLVDLPVRRNTIATLPTERLKAGLECLETRWADELGPDERQAFASLLDSKEGLIERFNRLEPTLCHGDPRADNLVFDEQNAVVLFDWQQMAVQFGETDLAWLAATSLDTAVRRAADEELVDAYRGDLDRYRLGMALPGLTVLLLAQRELRSARARQFVVVSLQRIAAAIKDLDVASL